MKLAGRLNKGDIVWSFNYDVLMDNALRNTGKVTDSGYVFRFDSCYTQQSIGLRSGFDFRCASLQVARFA